MGYWTISNVNKSRAFADYSPMGDKFDAEANVDRRLIKEVCGNVLKYKMSYYIAVGYAVIDLFKSCSCLR